MKLYFAAAAAALVASMPVHAAPLMSVGLKPAQECAIAAAKSDALTQRQVNNALGACNQAVAGDLSHVAMAGTLVNRGLVNVAAHRDDAAMSDFDAAIAQDPRLASAYITRGAAFLRAARYDAARADFNQAIALGTGDLHLAYFNRGEAQEASGNLVAAYHDYRKARELAPDFKPASIELARFQVNERRVATIR
jgi:tetratricopeptide (TPR) repeat protein